MSKILIIEDEVAIADLEKDYLELSGFDVAIENRGDKGLQTALKEEFDLIILDLMLPGMDGFEVCRKIRENSNVPILMVSAKKDDIDKIRGLGLGADDYITKPFSPSELVARVKAHMARYERLVGAGQTTNDIIEIRNLKIDKTARRVWIDGVRRCGEEFYHQGVRSAHIPCGESQSRVQQGGAFRQDLEYGERRRYRHGHCPYQEDQGEDRVQHVQASVY